MDDSIFDIFAPPAASPDRLEEIPIRKVQVQQIREAFAAAGVHEMEDRRAIVQSCTIRQINTVRDLLAKDVPVVLRRIREQTLPPKLVSGSAWDNRDEDTWIDKL